MVDAADAGELMDVDLMAFDMDGAIAAARPAPPRQTYQLGLFKPRVPRPPPMPAPDASNPSDRQRLLRLRFERFAASTSEPPPAADPADPAPLNAAQRRVAEHGADRPLSVRAGAGTGKTHTMMRRAVHLVVDQGVPPNAILMLTFSKKAATELQARLAPAFGAASPDASAAALPVAKTFHALAIFWIRQYWRVLGLGCPPVPLTRQAEQRSLMSRVLESHVMQLRLQRCRARMRSALPNDAAGWAEVLGAFERRFPDEFARARRAATEEVLLAEKPAEKKSGKRRRAGARDAAEAAAEAKAREEREAELETVRQIALCKHVDLELAAVARSSSAGGRSAPPGDPPQRPPDDLFERWLEPKKLKAHVRFYLDLVQEGRLRGHAPGEYLPEDAAIWTRYESMQRRDGLIDFDCMLTLFQQACAASARSAPLSPLPSNCSCHVARVQFRRSPLPVSPQLLETFAGHGATVKPP